MDRNVNPYKLTMIFGKVALRKEAWIEISQRRDFKRLGLRRSPQGERG